MGEYRGVLEESGVALPADMGARVLEKQKTAQTEAKRRAAVAAPAPAAGGASAQDVKELKIKLSHREKEIRELTQKVKDNEVFTKRKDADLKEAEKERDALTQKCEAMLEQLKSNNIEFNPSSGVIGSITSQEIIKVITKKDFPEHGFFVYDSDSQ